MSLEKFNTGLSNIVGNAAAATQALNLFMAVAAKAADATKKSVADVTAAAGAAHAAKDEFGDLLAEMQGFGTFGGTGASIGTLLQQLDMFLDTEKQMKSGKINFNARDFDMTEDTIRKIVDAIRTYGGSQGQQFTLDRYVAWRSGQGANPLSGVGSGSAQKTQGATGPAVGQVHVGSLLPPPSTTLTLVAPDAPKTTQPPTSTNGGKG